MRKILLLVSFITGFAILLSCKKSVQEAPYKRIQTINFSNGNNTSFEYNSDGNVSKIIENELAGTGTTTTFSYSGNAIYEKILHHQSGDIDSVKCTLNPQGYISVYEDMYNHSGYELEYNNSGNFTKTSSGAAISPVITYLYTNGNLISTKNTFGNNSYTYTYEYYTDKVNTLGNKHRGCKFMGISSINLIKKETYNDGSSSNVCDYTYEFDLENYVTKKIQTYSNGSTSWETYTYK